MTRFRPNPSFLVKLVATAQFNRHMDRIADAGLEFAEEHVPVDTGELKDSLHIVKEGPVRRIVAGTDHWFFPEFGTSTSPEQPYLRPIVPFLRLKTR